MTWKRWLFTGLSFAAVIGVSVFFILRWWRAGSAIVLPPRAHLWAIDRGARRDPDAHVEDHVEREGGAHRSAAS